MVVGDNLEFCPVQNSCLRYLVDTCTRLSRRFLPFYTVLLKPHLFTLLGRPTSPGLTSLQPHNSVLCLRYATFFLHLNPKYILLHWLLFTFEPVVALERLSSTRPPVLPDLPCPSPSAP